MVNETTLKMKIIMMKSKDKNEVDPNYYDASSTDLDCLSSPLLTRAKKSYFSHSYWGFQLWAGMQTGDTFKLAIRWSSVFVSTISSSLFFFLF